MELKLHTTFPESLKADWNALLVESCAHVPFLRYEYLSAWWQTRGGGEWPPEAGLAIVTAHQDGRLAGVAPLFHSGGRLLLLGSVEISDFLDLIVCPDDLPAFLDALLPFLLEAPGLPTWTELDLYNLLDSSPSLPALEQAATRHGLSCRQERLQHSPYIPLPGDWETYLGNIDKKQRHEIRRKMRRAESAEVPVRWRMTTEPAELEADMQAFFGLMAQDPDKAAFLTPAMREAMLSVACCALEEGCLQLAFLEVNGAKAAGYFSFDYLNRIWVYNSGIDRGFNEYSPGWVLLGYLLQWANENGRAEFDFMRGDEDYKYRFGAQDRFVMRATLSRS